MTTFLNQILYNNKKFDSYDSIASLDSFMHKSVIVSDSLTANSEPIFEPINENIENELTPIPCETSVFTIPRNEDTLFWCIYIAKFGYADYIAIGSKYKNKEIEKKQEMIDIVKKSPAILKGTTYKLTKVAVQEILAELMINKKTSMNTLYAMCILYNLNIYIIDESVKTYLHYAPIETHDKLTELWIIRKTIDGFYGIDMDTNLTKITNIVNTLLHIEHGPKPCKGMSVYKVGELEDMVKKLGVWPKLTDNPKSTDKKLNKTDVYAILQKTLGFL